MTTIEKTPAELIDAASAELGLTIRSEFIPFSKSRNAGEKHPTLNWRVTLLRNGREVLTTDYSAGCAHCPAYKLALPRSVRAGAIKTECEEGRAAHVVGGAVYGARGKSLQPDSRDVIWSLIMDSDVLNAGGFEEWASNFGYDTDSRKAESIYRACLEIALKLRNAIGEEGLRKLQEAGQDY